MKKIELIKMLLFSYIGLLVLFNLLTFSFVTLVALQLLITLVLVTVLLVVIIEIPTRRKFIWWMLLFITGTGALRPVIEFLFAQFVPGAAYNFFPPLTPPFSLVGFIIMLWAFILVLDPKLKEHFSRSSSSVTKVYHS